MTKKKDAKSLERVEINRPMIGLCYMQVCAVKDATDEEILRKCNAENLSGTANGWIGVCREDPKKDRTNPVQCKDHKDRMHFLVYC